jgi:hypothetical protein
MKDFIYHVLNEAMKASKNQMVETKRVVKNINVSHLTSPYEIVSYIEENNIPDCWMYAEDNNIYLAWNEVVEKTDEEKENTLQRIFETNAMRLLHKAVKYENDTELKYTTKVYDHNAKTKRFGSKTMYDLYISQDWEGIQDYFNLHFRKVKE